MKKLKLLIIVIAITLTYSCNNNDEDKFKSITEYSRIKNQNFVRVSGEHFNISNMQVGYSVINRI